MLFDNIVLKFETKSNFTFGILPYKMVYLNMSWSKSYFTFLLFWELLPSPFNFGMVVQEKIAQGKVARHHAGIWCRTQKRSRNLKIGLNYFEPFKHLSGC